MSTNDKVVLKENRGKFWEKKSSLDMTDIEIERVAEGWFENGSRQDMN